MCLTSTLVSGPGEAVSACGLAAGRALWLAHPASAVLHNRNEDRRTTKFLLRARGGNVSSGLCGRLSNKRTNTHLQPALRGARRSRRISGAFAASKFLGLSGCRGISAPWWQFARTPASREQHASMATGLGIDFVRGSAVEDSVLGARCVRGMGRFGQHGVPGRLSHRGHPVR
jgi:hypothetical protein